MQSVSEEDTQDSLEKIFRNPNIGERKELIWSKVKRLRTDFRNALAEKEMLKGNIWAKMSY